MKSLQSGWMAGCLLMALSVSNTFAAFTYWDPQGKGAGGPTNGIWDNANWSPNTTGSTAPVNWTSANGANFAVGATGTTPPFTVTMNGANTVGGVFNGFTFSAVNLTISGPGNLVMPSGQAGFNTAGGGITTVNVLISGVGAQLVPEGAGQLFLNATNTYTGGTQLGFSGSSFNGSVGFNNSQSFGPGPISFAFGTTMTLTLEGAAPVTITNAFANNLIGTLNCTLNGNPAGLTFSGPWNLTSTAGAAQLHLSSGGAGNLVALSGQISGTNGMTLNGPGTLVLSGANTYGTANTVLGSTTIASGPIVLANSSGSATGVSSIVLSGASSLLTGNGAASGPVTNSGTISATNLAGGTATLTTGSQTWQTSSTYQWAINNPIGTAGAASGWDELVINGDMTVAATGANPLVVNITSLTAANQPGALAGFNNTRDYTWLVIHSTSAPITGFSTASVIASSASFVNSLGTGTFTVSTNNTASGDDLFVNFIHMPSLSLSNLTVSQGSNAVFNAINTITGSTAATAIYSWTSNNVPMSDGGRISGSTTPTLTIANVQSGDAATYTVTATNAAGQDSVSVTLTVGVTSTVVTWPTPTAITYGAPLTTNQLNATANLPGNFVYTPPLATVLNAGANLLSVIFTPTDNVTYGKATQTVNQVVTTAFLAVTANSFTRPQGATNPIFTGTITGLQNGDNITATYSSSATSNSPNGTYAIIPSLVDPGNRRTNYNVDLEDGTLAVGTLVTWINPGAITYGTPLGSNQLNATANIPGTFVYNPSPGTVLNVSTSTLSVVFTPTDSVNYRPVTNTVFLPITPAPLTVTASNATRQAGSANPAFNGTIVGLQNGDNITATFSSTANTASPAGNYSIIPTLVDPGNRQTNYSVSLVNGTLIVTPPPPPITVGTPNIIPLPVTLSNRPGIFTLCPSQPTPAAPARALMQILVDGASQQTGQYLATALFKSTGYQFQVAASSATNAVKGGILITTSNAVASLGTEGYELTVAPDSVVIRAPAQGGAFYGVQSLLQLLPPQIYSPRIVSGVPWTAPCVYIQDQPLFSWRGVMLDVARHFINKDEIKNFLDAMAMHKLNTFHWHLVDDQGWRLEITNYPNLTTLGAWRNGTDYGLAPRSTTATNAAGQYGGFYTQADARDIVAYAAERHITVVPEIEMPCHSDAGLFAYGQFSCGDAGSYTMDYFGIQSIYGIDLYSLGTPGTMDFLKDVVSEMMAIFPSKYIHTGGDEVVASGDRQWNSYNADVTNMQALGITPNGSTSVIAYQHWFSTNMATFIQQNGRMMMAWTEFENGGIVTNSALMDWQTGTSSRAVAAATNGMPVVMSPDTTCYINYVEGTGSGSLPIEPGFAVGGAPSYLSVSSVYAFNPIPAALPPQYTSNILGAQCNLWAEYVPSYRNVMFKAFPRETAMAEITWTPRAQQSYSSFTNRLVMEKQRYDQMGLNYNHESNSIVGTWNNITTGGTTLNLDITTNVTAAGEIDINFWWLSGSPLAISSVALLVNGTQVDIDVHNGLAEKTATYQATQPFIPIFTLYILNLPELVPGATYTIQAMVAGSGGTSTNGTIYMPNWN